MLILYTIYHQYISSNLHQVIFEYGPDMEIVVQIMLFPIRQRTSSSCCFKKSLFSGRLFLLRDFAQNAE